MELAEKMNVSFQQIQKYEKGTTRIYISRLKELADSLNVKLETFTREIEEISHVSDAKIDYSPQKISPSVPSEVLPVHKEEKTLLRLFRKIKNEKLRKGVIKLLQGIIDMESNS